MKNHQWARQAVVLACFTACFLVAPPFIKSGEGTSPLGQYIGETEQPQRTQIIDLKEVLRLAGLENPTIALAEEITRADLAELTLARSLLFPSLNLGTTLSLHQGNLLSAQGIIRNVDRDSLYFGAGADVRGAGTVAIPGIILVTHLGDAFFAPRAAGQKVQSSSLDALATRNQILLRAANCYLALAGAEARLQALQQSANEVAEVVKISAAFAAKGQGRDGDARRAEGEALLLDGKRWGIQEDINFWSAELARLLSKDTSIPLRSETGLPPLLELVDPRTSVETLLQDALAHRPEIAARAANVALTETRLRQERIRPLAPTLVVGLSAGDFGGGSDQVGYRFNHFNNRTDVDVLAVWTLQNLGFGNLALQKRARAEIGHAEAERARMIDQVRREVAEALSRTNAQRLLMESARKRVVSAQKAFEEDMTRAKNLQGRLIEVLDSFNSLTAARQDYISSRVGVSQSQLNLYVALGNLPK